MILGFLIGYIIGVIVAFIITFLDMPNILEDQHIPIFASFMTSLVVGLLWPVIFVVRLVKFLLDK